MNNMNQFEYNDLDTKIENCQYRISCIDKMIKDYQNEKRELQEQLDQYIQTRNQNYQNDQHFMNDCFYNQNNYFNNENYFDQNDFLQKYNNNCCYSQNTLNNNNNIANNNNNNQYQLCSYNEIQEMEVEQCSYFESVQFNQNKNDFQDQNNLNIQYEKHNFPNSIKNRSSDNIYDTSSKEEDNHMKIGNHLNLWQQNKEVNYKMNHHSNKENKDIKKEPDFMNEQKHQLIYKQEELSPEKTIWRPNHEKNLNDINSPFKDNNKFDQKISSDLLSKNISNKDINDLNYQKLSDQFDEKIKNNKQDIKPTNLYQQHSLQSNIQANQKINPETQQKLTSQISQQSNSQILQQSHQGNLQMNQQIQQQQLSNQSQQKQINNFGKQYQNQQQQNQQPQQLNFQLNPPQQNQQMLISNQLQQQNIQDQQKLKDQKISSLSLVQQQLNSQQYQINQSDQLDNQQQQFKQTNLQSQKSNSQKQQNEEISDQSNQLHQLELSKQRSKKSQVNSKKGKSKQITTQQVNQNENIDYFQSQQVDQQQLNEQQMVEEKNLLSVLKNQENKLQEDTQSFMSEKNIQKTQKIKKEKKLNSKSQINNEELIKSNQSKKDKMKKGKQQINTVDFDNIKQSIQRENSQNFQNDFLNALKNDKEQILHNIAQNGNQLNIRQNVRDSMNDKDQNIKYNEVGSLVLQNAKDSNIQQSKYDDKVQKNQQLNNQYMMSNKMYNSEIKQNERNDFKLDMMSKENKQNVEYKKQLIVTLPNDPSLNQKFQEQILYLQELNEKRGRKTTQDNGKQNTCLIIIKQESLQINDDRQNTEDSQSSQTFLNNPSNKMNLEVNEADPEEIKQKKIYQQEQYKQFLEEFNRNKGDYILKEKGFYRYPSSLKMKIVEFSKVMKLIQIQKDTMISQETIRKWQKRYSEGNEKILQYDLMQ